MIYAVAKVVLDTIGFSPWEPEQRNLNQEGKLSKKDG